MSKYEPDRSGANSPRIGEGFVRSSSSYRNSERTRKLAEEVKKRSARIRLEAERIRGQSMITLLNADMNFRMTQKAREVVADSGKTGGARPDRLSVDDGSD